MTESAAPAPELQKFYVTFGVQYSHETHPYWEGADPAGWLTVLAPDEEAARFLVRSFIGLKWAFLYGPATFNESDDRRHFPKGELCRIDTDGGIFPAEGVVSPTPRFGVHDAEYYGRDSTEVVAARIEGVLKENSDADAIEALGYEAETFHPECYVEGTLMFKSISGQDRGVLASELDWNDPHECPVCERSIT